jgi:non-canonical poly(A) RNA polymerase PAPD5/7
MDPNIGWLQPEHKGPALDLWQRIWHQSNPNTERQPDFIPFGDESNDSFNTTNISTKLSSNQSNAVNNNNNKSNSTSNQISVSSNSGQSQSQNKRQRRENPASTYNLNDNLHLVSKYGGTPWRRLRTQYDSGILALHQEIEDFYDYMKPKPEEECMREDVVFRISKVVNSVWPHAKVHAIHSTNSIHFN